MKCSLSSKNSPRNTVDFEAACSVYIRFRGVNGYPRGEPKTANPTFAVRWGTGMEATEFSKTYFDASNPQQGFAALMVCGEADAACPLIKGAAARISMPYLDPKIYDDSTYEALKYAERRDDIGRLMLSVMMQVRNRLNQQSP